MKCQCGILSSMPLQSTWKSFPSERPTDAPAFKNGTLAGVGVRSVLEPLLLWPLRMETGAGRRDTRH